MKKRLILLLTIFITFMGSFAQQATSTQRLKFMGKSMDCSMSEMATHLKTKGCKIEDRNRKGLIVMSGTFQGYRNCNFVLVEKYNILESCNVVIPSDDMNKLSSVYNNIVYRFKHKYGVPSEFGYSFPCSNYSDLINGRCGHYSIFFIEGGSINIISISKGLSGYVSIMYEDSIAKDRIKKIQQDEL